MAIATNRSTRTLIENEGEHRIGGLAVADWLRSRRRQVCRDSQTDPAFIPRVKGERRAT
jgi:hypothetical protein